MSIRTPVVQRGFQSTLTLDLGNLYLLSTLQNDAAGRSKATKIFAAFFAAHTKLICVTASRTFAVLILS
jgi:hypothetical protein